MQDVYDAPPKRKVQPAPQAAQKPLVRYLWERSELVLSLGEAAARLGVSRRELETMIATDKIEALPTGFTRMIPTREITRLLAQT
jgi:excisionase family DNA binding protein